MSEVHFRINYNAMRPLSLMITQTSHNGLSVVDLTGDNIDDNFDDNITNEIDYDDEFSSHEATVNLLNSMLDSDVTLRPGLSRQFGFRIPQHMRSSMYSDSDFEDIINETLYDGGTPNNKTATIALSHEKYSKKTHVETMCSICLDEFRARMHVHKLPCHHIFHSKCIKKWITRNPACPVCRETVPVIYE